MVLFVDLLSGDELCSDSNQIKTVDEVMYEVMCNMIVVRTPEGDDGKPGAKTVIDVVENHQLVETGFDKKAYIKYIKAYMRRIRIRLEETDPERAEVFTTGSMLVVKKILANFSEFSFFMGKSQDVKASLAHVFYKEDGITPYMWLFRDGLTEAEPR